jgi:hypothetical protein
MAIPLLLILVVAVATQGELSSAQASTSHHEFCQGPGGGEFGGARRRVVDITHAYRADVPRWESKHGLGQLTGLVQSMADGDACNVSGLKLEEVHSGTHVDAPGHYVQEHYEAGLDVASLSLDVLIGELIKSLLRDNWVWEPRR